MNVRDLLENRHDTWLEWEEIRQACGPEGNPVVVVITIRTTVHNCVNLQRQAVKEKGINPMMEDQCRLQEFIAENHCAKWGRK